MQLSNDRLLVVGIGGTLRRNSTSLEALRIALVSAEASGATTELLDLNMLRLPMYEPDRALDDYDDNVRRFIETARRADAMIWSTAGYHGTMVGATKNALDMLEFLSDSEPPYLHERVVGLIATAGGELASVNAINAMVHTVHALRGTVAPLMVAIPGASRVFDKQGNLLDQKWRGKLEQLGRVVVENARAFQLAQAEVGG